MHSIRTQKGILKIPSNGIFKLDKNLINHTDEVIKGYIPNEFDENNNASRINVYCYFDRKCVYSEPYNTPYGGHARREIELVLVQNIDYTFYDQKYEMIKNSTPIILVIVMIVVVLGYFRR